jgi:hypothetical protein
MARTQGDGAHDGRAGIGRSAPPVNAFTADFLDRLLESDQPATAAEAAVAGPWEVEPVGGYGWGVFRQAGGGAAAPPGEGGGGGGGRRGEPAGLLEERQDALLLAAALPGSARGGELRLRPDRGPDGYPLAAGRRDVGRLAWFDTHLVATLAAFRALVACPRCLALVLEAAGHDALEQAGRIVARRTGTTERA